MKIALLDKNAILPSRKNPSDAGLDLHFVDWVDGTGNREAYLLDGVSRIARTGVTIEIPEGYFGWITNKSRSNFLVGAGIVDQGYQGELLVKLFNPTYSVIYIDQGDAIAQLILLPHTHFAVDQVSLDEIHLGRSARGADGGIVRQVEKV